MITTVQLDKRTKAKLDNLKIHNRESYNDLILRLIGGSSPSKASRESLIETISVLSDSETMKRLSKALNEKAEGKSIEEIEKELKL
jgi:hypothetical protein